MWDLDTYHCSRSLTGHQGDIVALSCSLKRLFSAASDFTVKIWDREKLLLHQSFQNDSITRSLITMGSRVLAATGHEIKVRKFLEFSVDFLEDLG